MHESSGTEHGSTSNLDQVPSGSAYLFIWNVLGLIIYHLIRVSSSKCLTALRIVRVQLPALGLRPRTCVHHVLQAKRRGKERTGGQGWMGNSSIRTQQATRHMQSGYNLSLAICVGLHTFTVHLTSGAVLVGSATQRTCAHGYGA